MMMKKIRRIKVTIIDISYNVIEWLMLSLYLLLHVLVGTVGLVYFTI